MAEILYLRPTRIVPDLIPCPGGFCPMCDSRKTYFLDPATSVYERACAECCYVWDGESRGIDGNIDYWGDGT